MKPAFTKKIHILIPYLKNKYVISTLVFIVWISFFDQNDFLSQYRYRQQLNELVAERDFYQQEIQKSKKALDELMSTPGNLEKFAREKYFMKKDNEDVFVIVYRQPEKNNDSPVN